MSGAQCEEDRQEGVTGIVPLPGKYSKLIEQSVTGSRKKIDFTLGKV